MGTSETSKSRYKIIFYIFLGIILGTFLKLFVIDSLNVSGSSMEPALKNKEKVLVNKMAYGLSKPFSGSFLIQWSQPKLDDVVIYLHENKIVVKRVVALAGDHLEFSQNSSYIVETNKKKISLTPVQYQQMKNFSQIPEGYVFTLGDNQDNSIDSRDYGFVSVKNITGKIIGK